MSMYANRSSTDDGSSQRSTRSNRVVPVRGGSISIASQQSQSQSSRNRSGSNDLQRDNSPQPGPSRLMNSSGGTDRQHNKSSKFKNFMPDLAELNLSEPSSEDEQGGINVDVDVDIGEMGNGMDMHEQSNDDEEEEDEEMDDDIGSSHDMSVIGVHTFDFNADTPLEEIGEKFQERLIKKGSGLTPSSKFTFSDDELPKTKAELRREYSHLIEKCQGFEENDTEVNVRDLLNENIVKGNQLFNVIGGGPGDMYLAFLHTKMCSGMLKHTMESMGNASSIFKKDVFLDALKQWTCQVSNGQDYKAELCVGAISLVASKCYTPAPHMIAMVGACDRDRIAVPPKEKKPRAAPRRKVFETNSALATQHEELNTAINKRSEPKYTRAEVVSKEISTILKKSYKDIGRPSPLLEFTLARSSLPDTVEHIFYIGFLIRDGLAALEARPRVNKRSLTNLAITPAEPPQKKATQTTSNSQKSGAANEGDPVDEGARNQFILSFSAKQWKKLVQVSQGDDELNISKPPPAKSSSK